MSKTFERAVRIIRYSNDKVKSFKIFYPCIESHLDINTHIPICKLQWIIFVIFTYNKIDEKFWRDNHYTYMVGADDLQFYSQVW